MAWWHEYKRLRTRLGRYANGHRHKTVVYVQRSDTDFTLFEAYFERKEVDGPTERPDGWIQLWPREPIVAPDAREAMNLALPLLTVAADRTQEELFEPRPCPVPIHRKQVCKFHSPTHTAQATVYRHSETRYEVRYFGDFIGCDVEEGWRLLVPPMEGEEVPDGFELLTIANCLDSAEQAASIELTRIIGRGRIKPKVRLGEPMDTRAADVGEGAV